MIEKIDLIDEMGVEQEFQLLATFGLDDFNYAVLTPMDSSIEETYILRIEADDKGGVVLSGIEDDEELKDAILAYESLIEKNTQ